MCVTVNMVTCQWLSLNKNASQHHLTRLRRLRKPVAITQKVFSPVLGCDPLTATDPVVPRASHNVTAKNSEGGTANHELQLAWLQTA